MGLDDGLDDIDDLAEILTAEDQAQIFTRKNLLSLGSTLLNLACTDKPYGGLPKGKYMLLVGDSDSGKTVIGDTILAEAAKNPEYNDYLLIKNDVENGGEGEIGFLGQRYKERVLPPSLSKTGDPKYSQTVEEMYDHLDDLIKMDRPFIEVVDSETVLVAEDDRDKIEEQKAARRKGKEAAGSYGTAKAVVHNDRLKDVRQRLRKTGSNLILISQTRDKIGTFGVRPGDKTRSGGWAMKFYASLEVWLSVKGNIEKTVLGKKRQIGIEALMKIKKNHLTGKKKNVLFPIYWSYGIDDIGSMMDYLIDEGVWSANEKTGMVTADDFDFKGRFEELAKKIDATGQIDELQALVNERWIAVEKASALKRNARYE